MNKKTFLLVLIIIFSIILGCLFILPYTSSKYRETISHELTVNISEPKYKIIFNSNGGTGTMSPQTFKYSVSQNLTENSFLRESFAFKNWNTKQDGTGTTYTDKQSISMLSEVDGEEITLYAQWIPAVAKIGNTIYTSLQAAINAVPTTNTETTVELLQNVSENLTVNAGMNIKFDLKNYTVSVNNGCLLTNNGTVQIINGTLRSTSTTDGLLNNEANGVLTISGGSLIMDTERGKQAVYNNGGTVTITGDAYLKSYSNPDPTVLGTSKARATVQNEKGTMIITGGTIESPNYMAVLNKTNLTVGTKDGNYNINSPVFIGATYGISSNSNFVYYDGILKGKTDGVNNIVRITDIEDNLSIGRGTEVINGQIYKTIYQADLVTVTFDPNGGIVTEPTRSFESGNPVGTLPDATRAGFTFDGWFTLPDGGTQITGNEIINDDITYYAHWTEIFVAELDGVQYHTVQAAVNAIPGNTQKTITLIRNSTEKVTVANGKKITIDLQGYTISNNGDNMVFENSGNIEITNGNIASNAGFSAINNTKTGNLTVNGVNITATGDRQAIYNVGGKVIITGNSVLTSKARGVPTGNDVHMSRGTIQNFSNGTVTILDATIINEDEQAIANESTLILGTSGDGTISNSSPSIRGETYGINNVGTINFYDGIVKGILDAVNGTITTQEANTTVTDSTEVIDNKTYKTKYLVENP